ncbi:hypothetical protein Vretimale_10131 [Volvox reticuliferus]|uniref:Transmembrane protein n=1 Tax=Volvox reticuliferus TaxID=1737510 RepID=A0A8J4C1Z5_9CHLO|nr:hypothetical protein Vretifemale_633 [Volvox reticuliferus]GIM05696.1 hypothetical protein Vretimale_10131 [Volvox reticuliferus]
MRASIILLIILGAAIQDASASGSFRDVLQRAKEEASHIATSLRDKERMQAKLKSIHSDLQDLYKLALVEVHTVAGPFIQAGQQSWSHFRARAERSYTKANAWVEQQHKRAADLHWKTVDQVHSEVLTRLPEGVKVDRAQVGLTLLALYTGIVALVLYLILRRCY